MGDAIGKARAARNVLERLGRKIPGVAGYLDRELVRELDHLVRSHLANSLDEARSDVQGFVRALPAASAGRIDRLGALEKELDALANALRHAGSGYSGLFDATKVGQAQLEELHRLDLLMVEDVEAAADASAHVAEGDGGIERLEQAVARARERLSGRDEAVRAVLA